MLPKTPMFVPQRAALFGPALKFERRIPRTVSAPPGVFGCEKVMPQTPEAVSPLPKIVMPCVPLYPVGSLFETWPGCVVPSIVGL